MKKQNIFRLSMLVFAVMAVSACSPFGNQSLIQDISNEIGIFIPGKTSTSVISSASSTGTVQCGNGLGQSLCPNGEATGTQQYSVTHSVGDAYQQPTFRAQDNTQTDSGYTVFSSVSGDIK
ncbi:MAG: hypothetical protein V4654_10820 [Bdellovibrionota bacterium]